MLSVSRTMILVLITALVVMMQRTYAINYVGGWLPSPPKAQCVDICVNAKTTPTCPTHDLACLAKNQRSGDFDYLVLEQLFVPQYCRDLLQGVDATVSHQNVNPAPRGIQCDPKVVRSELTIHGLWPNYNAGYARCCNVSETIGNQPFNAAAFAERYPELLATMAKHWVDPTQSNAYDMLCEMYNHEFQKHGLCYHGVGNDYEAAAVNYFESTLAVAAKHKHATRTIRTWATTGTRTTTLQAIEALFPKRVQVLCSRENEFGAIRSCFDKPERMDATARFHMRDCAPATKSSAFVPCNATHPITLRGYRTASTIQKNKKKYPVPPVLDDSITIDGLLIH